MPDGVQLYFSLDVIRTIKSREAQYVYKETGLTIDTLYNSNDFENYNEVAREILPEPLDNFLLMLMLNLPELEDSTGWEDRKEKIINLFTEIIGEEEEEEDGEEL